MNDGICLSLQEIQKLKSIQPKNQRLCSLSGYVIHGPVGRGQFSTVYLAFCKVKGRYVALKKISLWNMVDSQSRLNCVKEAHLLQKLNHHHIIEYIAAFIEGTELNIALEYADAGDLSRMIRISSKFGFLIPERTIWKTVLEISSGLEYMHSQKIMHRDIKPTNVFISFREGVKLGDLGIARYFSPDTAITHSLLGTPYYMSPERIMEKGYDFKSDIWSFGCLVYEMAALQPPFQSHNMNFCHLFHKIENVFYPPIPSDVYSKELRGLVKVCLEKEMEKRPDSKTVHIIAQEIWCTISKQYKTK